MGFKSYMKPVLMQCWLIESQLASVTKKKKEMVNGFAFNFESSSC